MAGSADEREIRDAVVARLRVLRPAARIIHELNCATWGPNRADVVAVSPQDIVAVEIKSKKDKLDRLQAQWDSFSKCFHHVIVAAHDKHFRDYRSKDRRDDIPAERHLNHPIFVHDDGRPRNEWRHRYQVWPYPIPEKGRYGEAPWTIGHLDRHGTNLRVQPRSYDLLDLLWADELRAECSRHHIDSSRRRTREMMILDMAWNLTGKQIVEAVCGQLRLRSFAEADAPVLEQAA